MFCSFCARHTKNMAAVHTSQSSLTSFVQAIACMCVCIRLCVCSDYVERWKKIGRALCFFYTPSSPDVQSATANTPPPTRCLRATRCALRAGLQLFPTCGENRIYPRSNRGAWAVAASASPVNHWVRPPWLLCHAWMLRCWVLFHLHLSEKLSWRWDSYASG